MQLLWKNVFLRVCGIAIISALAVLMLTSLPVAAQVPTGTILGVVKDSTGGSVPDAQVTLTNVETNAVRSITTGSDGEYRVPALQPGHYSVKVEKSGFKTSTQNGVLLDVAAEIIVNATMEVGSSSQQVTVTGEAPLVETTTSSLGGLVNDEKMADLPLNGRNFVDLALMQAGVTNDTNSLNLNAQGGNWGVMFSSNGAPTRSNTFTIDGAPMMNIHGNVSSAIGTTLGVDGIKEYKVITSAFSAEYGLQMGSQVVIVSKGGSNQFHGDVFEYLRNNAMDARNFFDYSYITTGDRLPQLQRNNFGGSFGGPIKKDKTFFYAVYEGLRQNQGATTIDNVFPANCHVSTGNPCATSSAPAGGGVPAVPVGSVAPAIIPILALYPMPNLPNNQFTYPFVAPTGVNFGQIRIDQNLSAADSFFGRYTVQNSSSTNATAYPQFQLQSLGQDQFITLSENHIFSPTILNTARISFSRTNLGQNALYPSSLVSPQFSLVPGQAIGTLTIGGITLFGPAANAPFGLIQNAYTASDDVYYTKGRHAFKFGALINRFENYDLVTNTARGGLSFNNAATFLAGLYSTGTLLTPGSDENREVRFYTYGFYAQDDWRVTSRFTLNLGLRYEISTTPIDRLGRNWAFRNLATDPTTVNGSPFRNPSFKNFGPRVGFAWDVFGNQKTSVRSAFGEYYDVANSGLTIESVSQGTPPLATQFTPPAATHALTLPVASSGTPGNSLHTQQYNINQPHLLQWNLTIEQQLAPSTTLSVSYVGTRGIHLWDSEEGNPCVPTAVTNGIPSWVTPSLKDCPVSPLNSANTINGRLNPAWGTTNFAATNADSHYNALQVVLAKRVTHGLEVQGAYTFGKVEDDAQGQFGVGECASSGANSLYAPNKALTDTGPSCFDVAHNVRVSVLYHIPAVNADHALLRSVANGWWVGSIVSWETGMPFVPTVSTWRSLSDHIIGSNSAGGNTDHANVGVAMVAPNATGPDGTKNTAIATATTPTTTKGQAVTFVPYDPSTVITGNPQQWFNPLMFAPGPVGFLGTATRGMLRGPHMSNVDFSVNKDTSAHFLGEAGQVEFRAEFFNIFNHANFGMPNAGSYAGTLTDTSQFVEAPLATAGVITNTVNTSRQIQLSLKLIF